MHKQISPKIQSINQSMVAATVTSKVKVVNAETIFMLCSSELVSTENTSSPLAKTGRHTIHVVLTEITSRQLGTLSIFEFTTRKYDSYAVYKWLAGFYNKF